MTKETIHQEVIVSPNFYGHNNVDLNYIKQKLTEVQDKSENLQFGIFRHASSNK